MPNVLVTMRFNDAQLDRLRAVSPELSVSQADPEIADYGRVDVLYAGSPPRDLARAPALKWVQLHMAGVNALADHPLYTKTALPLTTTSGVHAATIAEYAMTMLLALAHRVPRMVEWQGRRAWPPDEQRWPLFVPSEVRGATLGIIGYGSIGRELARIAKSAFGMVVLACKRNPGQRADDGYCLPGTGDPTGALPDEWLGHGQLDRLLARSDAVVLCAPLTPETQGMIGAAQLARMKPTAYFINVGRGASVDEAALARALAERRIAGAAVDVFAQEPPPPGHPLYGLASAILSPHVSGFLPSYDEKCSVLFAENLRRFLAGAPLLNLVDRARGY
ncbi:MAG TPA: D-2-hydroxyacid dehydrogenase [Candidatus Dormibacteraeota bacterium]|nr:D-2-hydroxyacid dehydrogenase [Candidatus Dormibacteraeota bacterium]